MKKIDFQHFKKNTLPVTLPSGLCLLVYPPKKSLLKRLQGLREDENIEVETYDIAAELLTNNKQGRAVSADELEDLDVMQIRYLFSAYLDFVREELQSPN